jgi:flagellar biosynthesis protein FlhF
MKVKRYIGQTTEEAMQKVKEEMGNEAVILNTRKIRQKGLTNFFRKPLIEVVAAVDELIELNHSTSAQHKKTATQQYYHKDFNTTKVLERLENQVSAMGELISRLTDGFHITTNNRETAVNSQFLSYYELLLKNEIHEDIAKIFMDKAINLYKKQSTEFIYCLKQTLLDCIGRPRTIDVSPNDTKVVLFIGPTGVGKTTTLAKLAAAFSLKENKKVGLITADTYRIAAVDQLKIYADILDIPLAVLYSPKEMTDALQEFHDKDIILIDTAGKSLKDKEQEKEIMEIISLSGADEIYLVINSNTSYSSCINIIESYGFVPDYNLLFTKLDEVSNYGIIINCCYITGKPLSYVTIGQAVPDDIEVANPDKLLSNIMRRVEL